MKAERKTPAAAAGPRDDDLDTLEGALLTSGRSLTVRELRALLLDRPSRKEILSLLRELQARWAAKSVNLAEGASGWRFVGTARLNEKMRRITGEKPPQYSRSFLETLAIIAYRQPVTRGEIESIRGVTVNTASLRQMQERGWIESVGRKDTPGHPALWATTKKFLDDFSMRTIRDLPRLEETAPKEGDGPAPDAP